jgi:Serine carboxypeptidase
VGTFSFVSITMIPKYRPSWVKSTLVVLSYISFSIEVDARVVTQDRSIIKSNIHRRQAAPRNDTGNDTSTKWKYATAKSEAFKVRNIPGLAYDFGELYSGVIPTANSSDRGLFYVFNPSTDGESKDLVIWLNGKV